MLRSARAPFKASQLTVDPFFFNIAIFFFGAPFLPFFQGRSTVLFFFLPGFKPPQLTLVDAESPFPRRLLFSWSL